VTEDEARSWLASTFDVSRGTWERLERYIALLFDEMSRQNLIAESTRDQVWARHIVDSAQLIPMADGAAAGEWVDLGSGAGLPGIVVAVLLGRPVVLVESRRKRIDFLQSVVDALALRVTVEGRRVEMCKRPHPAAVISARAFAPLDRLLAVAEHLADENTIWTLPKGRQAQNELASVSHTWQGEFHVERSITDPDSAIIVARNVKRKGRR
jgi:16S rRNA (guanine527-N7)-methyltransferase